MQPVKKFNADAVSVSVWENEKTINGKEQVLQSISIQRAFKDKDGEWQHSSSFRKNDLPNLVLAVQKAFEYLALKE